MIKIITATLFRTAVEVDSQGKIINTPRRFVNFKGLPFSILEGVLNKQKYQSLKIINMEE